MKTNIFKYKFGWLGLVFLALVTLTVTSCKDDEEGMGTPEITAVRSCDPAKADSTFTKAGPGSLIAIIGRNLADTRKVFINDQEVYFNATMNTDHSLIVTVPSESSGFILTAFDSSLKDEIRVETSHGTAVYAFKITAPYPQISRLQALYPRLAGDSLFIHGLNLVDVESIYFTDIPAAQLDSTTWKTVGGNHVNVNGFDNITQNHGLNPKTNNYETNSVLGIKIPELPYDKGTIVVETAAGTTYMSFYKNPGQPTISYISTDMPVIGEEVVIRGTEFVQVESITYGDVTLKPSQFSVADTEDEIIIPFAYVPEEGCRQLTITTPGGQASTPFFNYSCLLVDFDDFGTNLGWDPKALITDECDKVTPPYTCSNNYASFNLGEVGQTWWGTMVYFVKDWGTESANGHICFDLPEYDVIPADAPLGKVYLACEVFNNATRWDLHSENEPKNAYIRYYFTQRDGTSYEYDNFSWADYNVQFGQFNSPVLGTIDGEQPLKKWYRHVISFEELGMAGKTYADLKNGGLDEIRMMIINQSSIRMNVDFYIDNIRIYYKSN